MKTTKKFLSMLLAVLMVLSVFPAGVITLGAEDISLEVEGKDELNLNVGNGFNLLDENNDLSTFYLKAGIFHSLNSAWVKNSNLDRCHYEYSYITDVSEWARNESASLSMGLGISGGYAGFSAKQYFMVTLN